MKAGQLDSSTWIMENHWRIKCCAQVPATGEALGGARRADGLTIDKGYAKSTEAHREIYVAVRVRSDE